MKTLYNKRTFLFILLQRYDTNRPADVDMESYKSIKFHVTLEKHHDSMVSFHAQHGHRKSTIVLCCKLTLAGAVQNNISWCLFDFKHGLRFPNIG